MPPPGLQMELGRHLTFDLLPAPGPQSLSFHRRAQLTTLDNLHRNMFSRFQNIVLTHLVTDKRMDGRMNRQFIIIIIVIFICSDKTINDAQQRANDKT